MRQRLLLALMLCLSGAAAAQDGLGGMLPPAPPPPASAIDPIGDAFARLTYAEVEDDIGDGDAPITAIVTKDCVSELVGENARWRLDWRTIEVIGPGDTFVYVGGPGVKLAVVGDASRADQAQALSALHMAMRAMQRRCGAKPLEMEPSGES